MADVRLKTHAGFLTGLGESSMVHSVICSPAVGFEYIYKEPSMEQKSVLSTLQHLVNTERSHRKSGKRIYTEQTKLLIDALVGALLEAVSDENPGGRDFVSFFIREILASRQPKKLMELAPVFMSLCGERKANETFAHVSWYLLADI